MKKVGILSMQRIKNYGSFLQAYALKGMIEELGHQVEFVDYHVEKPIIEEKTKTNLLTKVTKELKGNAKFGHKLQYFKHKYEFGKKYFNLLGLTEEPNYNPKLDTLVIGSDEVFNCIQSNNNVGYSLELFGKDNNADKVITYAASFGNTTLEKLDNYGKKDEIAGLLNKMDVISVRDNNSYSIVSELTDKEIVSNLDPVLVYDYMNRDGLIPDIKVKEKYMIVYAYSGRISDYESKVIKKYAKEKGLKVYSIGGAQKCADRFIDCSPFEVLAYFKNAECIITDTFHGSIFSIINNKPFLTLVRKSVGTSYGNEEKLTALLEKLLLTNRIIYNIDDIKKVEENIDYISVNNVINENVNLTKKYLLEQLGKSKISSVYENKDKCCGCGACVDACPRNAISMVEDEYGFTYPVIDKQRCVNCGLCKKTCNFKSLNKNSSVTKSFAFSLKDKDSLKNSASGGVFFGIAKEFINNGGVVYGCSFEKREDTNLYPCHIKVDNLNDLKKLQGSKYVQSDTVGIFKTVKEDLDNGLKVLFSGTPCQVSALNGYLKKDYDNLITIDIICHGVPSRKMFLDYIKFLEDKFSSKVISFKFRDKKRGWGLFYNVIFENGLDLTEYSYKSSYYQMFLDSDIYRENCYNCPFANLNRISDITIGDFWGVEKEYAERLGNIEVKDGVSCVLVNTDRGFSLLKNNFKSYEYFEADVNIIKEYNHQLTKPSDKSKFRKELLEKYKNEEFFVIDTIYNKKYFIKNKIKDIIKK